MSVDLKDIMLSEFDYLSDEDIVQAVHNNDSEALEYLINKYRNLYAPKQDLTF